MTYEQALAVCAEGARVAAATMQPGQYVEHSFKRGFVRCWPVDKVEEEPQRTQCDFLASDDEIAAEWNVVDRPKVDSWGKPIDAAFYASLDEQRGAPEDDVKPRRSSWGNVSPEAKLIALQQSTTATGQSELAKALKTIAEDKTGAFSGGVPARDAWGRPVG